jgi:hypothetical protein
MSKILVKICGAAMSGKLRIDDKDYGKTIHIDYHIGVDIYQCVFEYRRPGTYYLTALLPYVKKDK